MTKEQRSRLPMAARLTLKCSIAIAGLAFATAARAECSRATLQALADTYVKAQTEGKAGLLPLADGASYAENNQAMDIAAGVPYVQLLPEASKTPVFALYRVSNAAKPDTYMLQYAPASNELYGGNLLALTASAGRAFLVFTAETRSAAAFTLRRSGEDYSFQLQSSGMYLSAEALQPPASFFLAPDGDLFHGHMWKAQTRLTWNAANMDGTDLRFVFGLGTLCRPNGSFRNAKLFRTSFAGTSLTGSHFDNADCTSASFTGATLTQCDFTGAVLKDAMLDGAIANGLIAPKADFDGTSFNRFGTPAQLAGANLDDAVFHGQNLVGVRFGKARLARAKLGQCVLEAGAVGTQKLPAAEFTEAVMPGAVLDGVRAAGVKFDGAQLGGASFGRAQLAGASFRKATLTRAAFVDAVFGEAGTAPRTDFTEATLYGIDFSGCRLDLATLATPAKFVEKPDEAPTPQAPRTPSALAYTSALGPVASASGFDAVRPALL